MLVLGHEGSSEGIAGPSLAVDEDALDRECCDAAAFPSDATVVGVESDSCCWARPAATAPAVPVVVIVVDSKGATA